MTLFIVLGFQGYRNFVTAGLQAEAHLLTSYIRTLERAYELENGDYIAFGPYGAAHRGHSNCQQPEGAKRLGFAIRWCQGRPGTEPVRYFYQVKLTQDTSEPIQIIATSGSDRNNLSFVCFGQGGPDIWESGLTSQRRNSKPCQ